MLLQTQLSSPGQAMLDKTLAYVVRLCKSDAAQLSVCAGCDVAAAPITKGRYAVS